jgi:hypothetical protein
VQKNANYENGAYLREFRIELHNPVARTGLVSIRPMADVFGSRRTALKIAAVLNAAKGLKIGR